MFLVSPPGPASVPWESPVTSRSVPAVITAPAVSCPRCVSRSSSSEIYLYSLSRSSAASCILAPHRCKYFFRVGIQIFLCCPHLGELSA